MRDHNAGVPSREITSGSPPAVVVNGRDRPQVRSKAQGQGTAAAAETKDSFREVVETVVFVVVLVLLLKSFVAEAFVIPTGSMAETLYGYQKLVTCPKCTLEFPVNCSSEVDPQQGDPTPVTGCICPNCRYEINFKKENMNPSYTTGDRVLVSKFCYDLEPFGFDQPKRYQVVVFKYPKEPQKQYTPLNYIKRLIGRSGETIAIYYGKLYKYEGLSYEEEDREVPWQELWQRDYMHVDDQRALDLFRQGKFQILRKPPDQILAEKRLVYDNDHQAKDLIGKVEPRWHSENKDGGWTPNDPDEPKIFRFAPKQAGENSWLVYEHLLPDPANRTSVTRCLVTDFMGYNTWIPHQLQQEHWVGDLMLECDVDVLQSQGELVLELSKGVDRFRARWDLSSGFCTLSRLRLGQEQEEKLDSRATSLKKPGKYQVRFANVDERLVVWVNSSLPFEDGVVYEPPPPQARGPRPEHDLQPARIGARDATLTVSRLKLWRDTYYTIVDPPPHNHDRFPSEVRFNDPQTWTALDGLPPMTMYVQPGHFLCLGDNSPESSDGRMWGAVPRRLLLGRALLVYWPFGRAGRIE
jgi:signal peptidase I